MDLLGVFRAAFRRWWLFIPLLVATFVLGAIGSMQVATAYQAGGPLVVNYPYASNDEAAARLAANPYYDTRTAASVMGALADAPDVRDAVVVAGGSGDYTVNVDSGRPMILVGVTDNSEKVALNTYSLLADILNKRMNALQEAKRVPAQYRVTVDDVLKPKQAAASTGGRTKVLLASVVAGLILSLALCVYVDYRIRRFGRFFAERRKGHKDDDPDDLDEIVEGDAEDLTGGSIRGHVEPADGLVHRNGRFTEIDLERTQVLSAVGRAEDDNR